MSGGFRTCTPHSNVRKPLVIDEIIGYDCDMETTANIYTNFDLCYRAVCSRDARFDGRFFTAVTSTGIYCRPVCPATTPLARHVRFYSCAAAAEAAGFRACKRCHPEASPGSPDWNVRADLVARALHLIADGVVDTEGVAGLARRLAVSERHLHRELVAEVGAGPLALSRSRRAQTARLLIDQTHLSLTTIAFAAGFASVRQFNETMQTVFGCAPSELRRHVQSDRIGNGRITLRLHYRPPFDAETLLAYLNSEAIAGVEEVNNGCYGRTIAFPRSKGIIELEPTSKNAVRVHLQLDNLNDISLVVQRCRHLFDLDADSAEIDSVLAMDSLLAPLVTAHPGRRVPGTMNGFELAVRAIIPQHVAADEVGDVLTRLVTTFGEALAAPQGTLTHFFPSPRQIVDANLQVIGLPSTCSEALHVLARAVVSGELVLERDADREKTMAQLLAIPAVNQQTATHIAMRALGDPDAFSVSDVQQVFAQHGIDAESVVARTEAWRPWRAYAVNYLADMF